MEVQDENKQGKGRKKGEKKTCLGPEHLSGIISVTLSVLVDVKHMTSLFPFTDVIQETVSKQRL